MTIKVSFKNKQHEFDTPRQARVWLRRHDLSVANAAKGEKQITDEETGAFDQEWVFDFDAPSIIETAKAKKAEAEEAEAEEEE